MTRQNTHVTETGWRQLHVRAMPVHGLSLALLVDFEQRLTRYFEAMGWQWEGTQYVGRAWREGVVIMATDVLEVLEHLLKQEHVARIELSVGTGAKVLPIVQVQAPHPHAQSLCELFRWRVVDAKGALSALQRLTGLQVKGAD